MVAVRFCSACGTVLSSAPPVRCAACGTRHWLNPKPCANAVVLDSGRVLLARRAHDPWRGLWGAPGGFCEVGEHPTLTAEREVYEETGLQVRVTGYLGVWIDAYADPPAPDDAETINVAYYHAVPVGEGGPPDPAEVSELGWFSWDELPDELAPPETLVRVLSAARASVGNGTSVTALPDQPA